ncbi:MAG: hypothetical protein HQK54_13160 [Oligoflexales bacterium]|nr:hypothetical protein [Oligoflexales bacterium]
MIWKRLNIRVKLSLWFSAALGILLVIYSIGLYHMIKTGMYKNLDSQLRDDFEIAAELLETNLNDKDTLPKYDTISHFLMVESRFFEIWDADLKTLIFPSGERASGIPLGACTAYPRSGISLPDQNGNPFRQYCSRFSAGLRHVFLRVGRSENQIIKELDTVLVIMYSCLPFSIITAAALGYFLAKRALSPVAKLTHIADSITVEKLDEEVPVDNPYDELGILASVFNKTFCRLKSSFDQVKRFTSDASHELRTPLTAMRMVAEVGLSKNRSDREYREIIGSLLEETVWMSELVEKLLFLSKADTGAQRLSYENVNVDETIRSVITHYAILAEDKNQSIEYREKDGNIKILADPTVFRLIIKNLITNSIIHCGKGANIEISTVMQRDSVMVSVRDNGPGIAKEHQKHIFDRFYRVDSSRCKRYEGNGLGLSIVDWGVRAHGGRIDLKSEVNGGTTFNIFFPVEAV